LRTNTRRLEATIAALGLGSNGNERRLLRELAPIRKRAGKVRDMDVLTADAANVHLDGEQDCQVQVLEYLGAERERQVEKLRALIRKYKQDLRRREKRSLKDFEKVLQPNNGNQPGAAASGVLEAMADALKLSSELAAETKLDRKNLHPYRLKVKELRYVLQLASTADEHQFVEKLGEVKDAIGEWHDWEELIAIADGVVDHGPNCKLMRKMKAISRDKYETALDMTNNLIKTYLRPKDSLQTTNGTRLTEPVFEAISAIA
jgi:CHAD domain-containing protein